MVGELGEGIICGYLWLRPLPSTQDRAYFLHHGQPRENRTSSSTEWRLISCQPEVLCFVHFYCCTDHAPTTHHSVGDDMAVDSWPTVVDSTGGGVRDQRVRTMERSSHANADQECVFDA